MKRNKMTSDVDSTFQTSSQLGYRVEKYWEGKWGLHDNKSNLLTNVQIQRQKYGKYSLLS